MFTAGSPNPNMIFIRDVTCDMRHIKSSCDVRTDRSIEKDTLGQLLSYSTSFHDIIEERSLSLRKERLAKVSVDCSVPCTVLGLERQPTGCRSLDHTQHAPFHSLSGLLLGTCWFGRCGPFQTGDL